MPSLKFPYTRFRQDPSKDPMGRSSIVRPILPVKLLAPTGGGIDTYALVDTGADDTIFDHELADAVGIDWRKGQSYEIIGVNGGKLEVHFKTATYELHGHRFTASIGFAALAPFSRALLGQMGFFDQAICQFDQSNNSFEVKF